MGHSLAQTIFFAIVLTARPAYPTVLTGPVTPGNHHFQSHPGRRLGGERTLSSDTATGRQLHARSLGETECYELMAPKVQLVAMMFLIRAKIHPENIWRDWLLPTSKVVHPDIECDSQIKACYKDIVLTEPARSVYDEQGFFTIYVHAKPGAPAFKEGSIFYQREVRDPIETEWGSHTLSQATRRLLQAALENPLNQRFVLMCGTSIPVRPPAFTYSQLIGEQRSRFDGYRFTSDDEKATMSSSYRHPISLQEEWPEYYRHATGHGQFWVLIRKHAEIVDADEFVDRLFARHCFTSVSQRLDVESRQWCVSDEQYVGTVLNKALGHELRIEVAAEDPAMVTWLTGDGHPPEDITKQFILKARNAYNMSSERLEDNLGRAGKLCHASESPQWHPMVLDFWVDKCTEYHINVQEQPPVVSSIAAYPHCPLFLRKFKERAIKVMAPLLHDMRITSAFNGNHRE